MESIGHAAIDHAAVAMPPSMTMPPMAAAAMIHHGDLGRLVLGGLNAEVAGDVQAINDGDHAFDLASTSDRFGLEDGAGNTTREGDKTVTGFNLHRGTGQGRNGASERWPRHRPSPGCGSGELLRLGVARRARRPSAVEIRFSSATRIGNILIPPRAELSVAERRAGHVVRVGSRTACVPA